MQHFAKEAKLIKGDLILQLLDDHTSRLSISGINYSKDSGEVSLSFPPYTSHKLQPFDRIVIGSLKEAVDIDGQRWALPQIADFRFYLRICGPNFLPQVFANLR